MEKLSGFLKKYSRFIKDNGDFNKIVIQILDDVFKFKLKETDIIVKNRSLFIKCPQILKGEILIKQSLILKTINEKTKLSFKELRF